GRPSWKLGRPCPVGSCRNDVDRGAESVNHGHFEWQRATGHARRTTRRGKRGAGHLELRGKPDTADSACRGGRASDAEKTKRERRGRDVSVAIAWYHAKCRAKCWAGC